MVEELAPKNDPTQSYDSTDTVTPLKKRRLMRESVESISSPLSPTMQSFDCTTTTVNSTNRQVNFETDLDDSDQLLDVKTGCLELLPVSKEGLFFKINGLRADQSESSRKISIKDVHENLKEGTNKCETSVCTSLSPNCQDFKTVNSTLASKYKGLESSMQNNCDFENKVCNSLKSDCVQENDLDISQSTCKSSTSDIDVCSDLHPSEKAKSDSETEKDSSIVKSFKDVHLESTSDCSDVKQKISISGNCNFQSSITENRCSSSFQMTNNSTACPTETKEMLSSEKEIEHTLSKIQKLPVYNSVSENSLVQLVPCENTKDSSSNLISQDSEVHSPIKNTNASVDVSLDNQNEHVDSGVNLHKKLLTDLRTSDSEMLCCNSPHSNDINDNHIKSDFSDLESKSPQLSTENSGSTKTTSASSPQKRKVSLSEYRLRMKDCSSKRMSSESLKRSTSCPATAIPETLPDQVTLAPLPLFESVLDSKSPPQTSTSLKNLKKKAEIKSDEESFTDVTEHRENLTERLKREFGFDDDSEVSTLSQATSLAGNASTLVISAQPPPPPPPPPRTIRSSQPNIGGATAASPSQFGFSMSTPYARPSYIIPQVPSAQFIPVQQTVNTPVLSSVHPITTPGVQCSVRTTLLPAPHSFAPSLSGTVLQPSVQHEFSSVNAQNFAALVQQPPPPPPPPKTYPHVYQSSLYK